jgi:hypothetical protein
MIAELLHYAVGFVLMMAAAKCTAIAWWLTTPIGRARWDKVYQAEVERRRVNKLIRESLRR